MAFLVDAPNLKQQLAPLTLIRPIGDIRLGILTLKEKWERALGISLQNQGYPLPLTEVPELCVLSSLLPNKTLVESILSLKAGQTLTDTAGQKLAFWTGFEAETLVFSETHKILERPWQLFLWNGEELACDFELLTKGRSSAPIVDPYVKCYQSERIFLEPGAIVRDCTLNAESGPIYIGAGAEIQEGCTIRGGAAFMEGSVAAMGAKFRGNCTIGPYSKVGGENNNVLFFGFSNKGHDGYLGNSVIAEWCNLAAATNNSNMKNNHGEVRMYDYATSTYIPTGLAFCGMVMGDFSRCGIGSTFNTGTVVGLGVNLFDTGFPSKFIPDFYWGTPQEGAKFKKEAFFKMAEATMALKKRTPDSELMRKLESLYESASPI